MSIFSDFYSFTQPCIYNSLKPAPKILDIQKYHDVIKWKHFPRYWPFVRGIHRSPLNSPHKGQWLGALMFSLICTWINGWINNREAGDLRRYRAHYDVIVMNFELCVSLKFFTPYFLVVTGPLHEWYQFSLVINPIGRQSIMSSFANAYAIGRMLKSHFRGEFHLRLLIGSEICFAYYIEVWTKWPTISGDILYAFSGLEIMISIIKFHWSLLL